MRRRDAERTLRVMPEPLARSPAEGNTISATFPRTDLPEYVEAHRALDRLFSYTCVEGGDCAQFLDSSVSVDSFTI